MSKFLDRLEQINLGTSAALGFGVSRTQKPPGMALVGVVSGGHDKGIKTLTDLEPDAVIVSGIEDPSTLEDLAKALDGETGWGAQLQSLNEEQAQALEEKGCDLVAFSIEGTTVTAVASENMARLLCVEMDVDVDQLPAIGALPVDALLLPMGGVSGSWTLQDLAAIGKISRRVSQYILVEVSQAPSAKELEALRKVGVHGLVVDAAAVKPKKLAELKAALQEMPRQRSDRRDRPAAVVPTSAFPGGFSPEQEESRS